MRKLVDVKCQACGKVIEDVLVDPPNEVGRVVEEEGPPGCEAQPGKPCGPVVVVLSVARHSKHSSWSP
jgi:hypothetical protein